ncbi:hypothetical protein C8R45DRAFT_933150 [Mycena sanguinolenta]|nr:hypothetical protein C8R45DRAFT_933150 [Mycena sanguinolenta]
MEELEDEEKSHRDEIKRTKELNKAESKKKGRRRAVRLPFPETSAQLNELRARSADRAKLKSWFSNVKTKQKLRKLEPFAAWLARLKSLQGAPRRIQIPWVLWQDPTHGEVLRERYQTQYHQDADSEEDEEGQLDGFEKEDAADNEEEPSRAELLQRKFQLAQTYFKELNEEEQAKIQERRETDFAARHGAYERVLKGEVACSADELADRRRHAEAVSQRTLESLCAQMGCKGLLLLGEVIESNSEGDDREIFLSKVQHGSLPKHPEVDFTKWTPVRSKAVLQAFADFLVACKTEEKGLLRSLSDTNAVATPSLCAQCMKPLIPLPNLAPPTAPDSAATAPAMRMEGETLHAENVRRSKGKGGRRRKGDEEEEAQESGADDDKDRWPGSRTEDELAGDSGADEDEPVISLNRRAATPSMLRRPPNTPLRQKLNAMPTPRRDYNVRLFNSLTDYEFEREKTIASNEALFRELFPQSTAAVLFNKTPKQKAPTGNKTPLQAMRASGRLAALHKGRSLTRCLLRTPPMRWWPQRRLRSSEEDAMDVVNDAMSLLPASAAPASPAVVMIPSAKHQMVYSQLVEVKLPLWIAALEAWRVLEDATGFQTGGKALSAQGRPEAVGWWVQQGRKAGVPTCLDSDDERDDFYEGVVRWWIALNPGWRKEGTEGVKLTRFAEVGLLRGAPVWRKVVEDVTWVLTEKVQVVRGKCRAPESEEEPPSKRLHV